MNKSTNKIYSYSDYEEEFQNISKLDNEELKPEEVQDWNIYWSPKDLQKFYGYENWEEFKLLILKIISAYTPRHLYYMINNYKDLIITGKEATPVEDFQLNEIFCEKLIKYCEKRKDRIKFARQYHYEWVESEDRVKRQKEEYEAIKKEMKTNKQSDINIFKYKFERLAKRDKTITYWYFSDIIDLLETFNYDCEEDTPISEHFDIIFNIVPCKILTATEEMLDYKICFDFCVHLASFTKYIYPRKSPAEKYFIYQTYKIEEAREKEIRKFISKRRRDINNKTLTI